MRIAHVVGMLALAVASAVQAAPRDVQHPFLLWTKEEAAQIKKRIETDPAAKIQYERMMNIGVGAREKNRANNAMNNLFKYSVMGDEAAGQAEKKALLGFIGQRPPGNKPGDPNSGNAQWRDDRTLDALRYDILYDLLSDAERKGVENTINGYVNWLVDLGHAPWKKEGHPKTAWLPNMQWPTVIGVHDLAVASKDEKLIRACFNANGGWKWYFDEYVAGDRWYMEEFGKYYSNIGAMMIWCEGLERLGLSQYGYGYTGKNGATMRKFLNSPISSGYPRLNRGGPGTTPHYGTVNMGDAGPLPIVTGYTGPESSGMAMWGGGRMNGPIPKMMQPLWWEMGARRFPEDGYHYFLAQLRRPDETIYYPTLYFGLGPVDSTKVTPPAAPSVVSKERGFALLRADESPSYWEGPKPAVALQFGMYYVHYVHDCFAILQYISHNRTIYDKMGAVGGGYAGGDPWRDHVRGQGSGVVIDGAKVKPVDTGDEGCKNQRIRSHLVGPAKFTAVRATMRHSPMVAVDPNQPPVDRTFPIEQERAVVLTDEYLFDAFFVRDPESKTRVFDWHVLSPATLSERDAETFKPVGDMGNAIRNQAVNKPHILNVVARDAADEAWAVTLDQSSGEKTAGVTIRMLPEKDTALVAGTPPGIAPPASTGPATAPAREVGFKGLGKSHRGIQFIATRTGNATAFVALHEPFVGAGRVAAFDRIQQTPTAVAARVTGKDLSDRILIDANPADITPVTLGDGKESFTFSGYGFVRVTPAAVVVTGDVTGLQVQVSGTPKLTVNGKDVPAQVAGGVLKWSQ